MRSSTTRVVTGVDGGGIGTCAVARWRGLAAVSGGRFSDGSEWHLARALLTSCESTNGTNGHVDLNEINLDDLLIDESDE